MLYYSRRFDEAEIQGRKALELDPGLSRVHIFLARIYLDSGQYERSLKERAILLGNGDTAQTTRLEEEFNAAFRGGGREGLLRKQLEESRKRGRIGGLVEFCAALGDKECTFEGIKAAEKAGHPILDYVKVDPYFDFIRADNRYSELLRRLNLPL